MTTRAPRPAAASACQPPAADARSRPDPVAVSPAFGPAPPVYVPRTRAEAAAACPLWRLAVRAAGRAVHCLRRASHARARR